MTMQFKTLNYHLLWLCVTLHKYVRPSSIRSMACNRNCSELNKHSEYFHSKRSNKSLMFGCLYTMYVMLGFEICVQLNTPAKNNNLNKNSNLQPWQQQELPLKFNYIHPFKRRLYHLIFIIIHTHPILFLHSRSVLSFSYLLTHFLLSIAITFDRILYSVLCLRAMFKIQKNLRHWANAIQNVILFCRKWRGWYKVFSKQNQTL